MKKLYHFFRYVWRIYDTDQDGEVYRISVKCAWKLAQIHCRPNKIRVGRLL